MSGDISRSYKGPKDGSVPTWMDEPSPASADMTLTVCKPCGGGGWLETARCCPTISRSRMRTANSFGRRSTGSSAIRKSGLTRRNGEQIAQPQNTRASALLWEVRMVKPLDGFVMPPTEWLGDKIASVICGHDFVQQWLPDEQAEFHSFVREVLRSFALVGGERYD